MDGYAVGGEDCLDNDPTRLFEPETLGDVLDSDCDGGADSIRMSADGLEGVALATGLIGPAITRTDDALHLGWGFEEMEWEGYTYYDGLSRTWFDIADPAAGPIGEHGAYGYSSDGGNMGLTLDIEVTDDFVIWLSSLYSPYNRTLYLDMQPQVGLGTNYQYQRDTDNDEPFADMDLYLSESEDLRAIACDGDGEISYTFIATLEQLDTDTDPAGSYGAGWGDIGGSACAFEAGRDQFLIADHGLESLGYYSYRDRGLEEESTVSPWAVTAIDATSSGLGDYLVVGDDTPELTIEDATGLVSADIVGTTEILGVLHMAVADDGEIYICGVDGSGGAWMIYGRSGGFTEVELVGTGLTEIEDCAIGVSPAGVVLAAVRAGNELVWGTARQAK